MTDSNTVGSLKRTGTTTKTYENGVTKEELDAELDRRFQDFYRRVYPGFEITSGLDTLGHGRAELCITTDTKQALHFYEQGNCKLGSRKSIEIRSGDKATEKEIAITISSENGHIKIAAGKGDLILEGKNVIIQSTKDDGQVTIKSKKNLNLKSPSAVYEAEMMTIKGSEETILYGGTSLDLYCESNPVETASGQDPIIASSLLQQVIGFMDKAKQLTFWS